VSTFCNWLLNTAEGNMTIDHVIAVMQPFYKATGIDIMELRSFSRTNGSKFFQLTVVPPGSDIYFLAQIVGKLTVIQDEVDTLC